MFLAKLANWFSTSSTLSEAVRSAAIKAVLIGLVAGELRIAKVYTDTDKIPEDDCAGWSIEVRTNKGHELTFHFEGSNISSIHTAYDEKGRELISPTYPLSALAWLPGQDLAKLEITVLSTLAQSLPA